MATADHAEHAEVPAPARLALRGVTVARPGDGAVLLEAVDLSVPAGAIVTLEGPSGCGKTSLLRVLADLAPALAGDILLDGKALTTFAPAAYRRQVAFVPQQAPMFEGTVADNVASGPAFRGEALSPARVTELLARVSLSASFAGRIARDLSGGERQRVALARAFANQPRVLLLDEPTAGLDPQAASGVIARVLEASRRGEAFVVVTHLEEHARKLGAIRYRCAGRALVAASSPS